MKLTLRRTKARTAIAAIAALLLLFPRELREQGFWETQLLRYWDPEETDKNFARHLFASNRPSAESHIVKINDDGKVVYNVTYNTDALRRRVNPYNHKNSADRQILFMGCSVTFGNGLTDEQTIPAQTTFLTKKTQTFNYGTSGYGPGHVLAYLRYFDLAKQYSDPESKTSLVFIWGDYLFDRANASALHMSWGGATTPYFSLDSGKLTFRGNMRKNFPFEVAVSRYVFQIPLLGNLITKYLGSRGAAKAATPKDVELNLQILREAFAEYRRQFKNDRFYVVLYPYSTFSREMLKEPLERSGIKVIDLTKAFEGQGGPKMIIQGDGHPSPAGARLIAEKIVEALSLP